MAESVTPPEMLETLPEFSLTPPGMLAGKKEAARAKRAPLPPQWKALSARTQLGFFSPCRSHFGETRPDV